MKRHNISEILDEKCMCSRHFKLAMGQIRPLRLSSIKTNEYSAIINLCDIYKCNCEKKNNLY